MKKTTRKKSIRKIDRMIRRAKKEGKHEVLVRDDELDKKTFEHFKKNYNIHETIWVLDTKYLAYSINF